MTKLGVCEIQHLLWEMEFFDTIESMDREVFLNLSQCKFFSTPVHIFQFALKKLEDLDVHNNKVAHFLHKIFKLQQQFNSTKFEELSANFLALRCFLFYFYDSTIQTSKISINFSHLFIQLEHIIPENNFPEMPCTNFSKCKIIKLENWENLIFEENVFYLSPPTFPGVDCIFSSRDVNDQLKFANYSTK